MEYDPAQDDSRKKDELRKQQLAAFASSVVLKRKEAIDARKLIGIETIWAEDENYYNGIDEYNLGDALQKPTTKEGRVSVAKKGKSGTKSTAFVNITQPYVDLVTAREFDMLFPVDDKPFSFEPTPVPEVSKLIDSQKRMPDGQMTEGDAAKAFLQEAKEMADGAENQVWDWLAESNWHTEGRKVIQQKNMIGTGVLKGPFPELKTKNKVLKDSIGIRVEKYQEIVPSSRYIDAWNLYPDPACGNNIHNGAYIFEKDKITGKKLRMLKGGAGYMDEEIDKVLEEGPSRIYLTDEYRRQNNHAFYQEQDLYEIWYYHGQATKSDMESIGCECNGDIDVLVVLVNDHVIKAAKQLLVSGQFPYDVFVYQERVNYWAGIGVARNVRVAQNMVNAATRAMMDNSGLTAGPQIIYRDGIIRPADGVKEITPHKLWLVDEDATVQDVRDAFMSIVIPNNQQHMEAIIRLALEFAERVTSMPLMLQGQQGTATDTVGGMQILQQNSNTVLRRTAKLFDDVIERHIGRYYDWLMEYGDNDKIKGDINIIVKGSSALYERDAQNQAVMQLIQFSADPGFMLSKERLMIEVLKSNKISPDRVSLTDEEKKNLLNQPPPQDPAIQVAQVKIDGELKKEQLKQQNDERDIEMRQQETENEFALKLQMQDKDNQIKVQLAQMQRDLKIMELSQARNQSIDSIKAALASDSMKLATQKELSYASMMDAGHHKERDKEQELTIAAMPPPTEPVGKAPPGESYQK